MRVLSLFDGISCGRLALHRAGLPVTSYTASEIDSTAISISAHNWRDINRVGDIRNLSYGQGEFDLVMGGSPCQGLSLANPNRLNLKDSRSSLFFDFVRLKNEIRPTYFLLENVVCDDDTKGVISEFLGVEPVFINSSDFSAQNRKRLYWTNIPILEYVPRDIVIQDILYQGYPKTVHIEESRLSFIRMCSKERMDSAIVIGKIGKGRQGERIYDPLGKSAPLLHSGGGIAGAAASLVYDKSIGKVRKLNKIEVLRLQNLPDDYIPESVSDSRAIRAIGNGWTVDVVCHILKGIQ